jgi:TatD DNase family protein
MIDTHCHIDQFPEPEAVARSAEKRAITTVAVTNLPSHYAIGLRALQGFKHVHLALGLHPLAARAHAHEIEDFLRLAPSVLFVGEIGLDFSRAGDGWRQVQISSFHRIVESLCDRQRFVTVHSRGAEIEVLEILQRYNMKHVVFHWFTGSRNALLKVLEAGHFLSVNTAMITTKKWRELFPLIPKGRILTESDGPYARYGSRSAEPADIRYVLVWLAEQWDVTEDQAECTVRDNFQRVLPCAI